MAVLKFLIILTFLSSQCCQLLSFFAFNLRASWFGAHGTFSTEISVSSEIGSYINLCFNWLSLTSL